MEYRYFAGTDSYHPTALSRVEIKRLNIPLHCTDI